MCIKDQQMNLFVVLNVKKRVTRKRRNKNAKGTTPRRIHPTCTQMDKYLSSLITIAQDVLPVGHAKVAACIVYKGEIISIGYCSYKTHPLQKRYGRNVHSSFLHAEVDALVKAQKRVLSRGISLKKCTMYVARVKRPYAFSIEWTTGLAKPCSGCERALTDAGLTRIVYTT